MIPQTFIQDLLARVDIVDVIDGCVPLKRGGANFSARCPFHNEKSPSFTVSPAKQFYHCFGCGAHGTAISFLMEYHGMGFIDAVRDLAARVGMVVPEDASRSQDVIGASEGLGDVLDRATKFYRGELKKTERAVNYLKSRGLTGEIAARYGLGFAPEGWQALESVFEDYRENRALVTAGLVIENADGRRYDRFRDRIMFPIVGQRGGVIGFGGRVLDGGEPKYLNSPETPLFEKGRELYGLFQARQAIRAAGMILVVEGYMDVVALAQFDVGYAVATLGTATTPQHVQKLLRQTDQVVYAFDGDQAGRRAAWRALENSLSQLIDGKKVSFLFLPEGEDPDSYVRSSGKQAFEALLRTAQPLSEFMLQELGNRVDMGSAEGRAKFLQDAKPLVKQITAPMLSLVLRKQIAEIAGVSQSELDDSFEIKTPSRRMPQEKRTAPAPSLVRKLSKLLLLSPSLALSAEIPEIEEFADLAAVEFRAEEFEFFRELLEVCRANPDVRTVAEHFRGTPWAPVVQELETSGLVWGAGEIEREALEIDFRGAWRQLIGRLGKARISELLEKSKRAGLSPEDKELFRRLQLRGASQ
jgi:DNA primase